ncbi:MAG: hypothetical protein MJB14_15870 [Spirochaetes bacterium]|nr:hypothetical protein [Spirochaetota bacterium]
MIFVKKPVIQKKKTILPENVYPQSDQVMSQCKRETCQCVKEKPQCKRETCQRIQEKSHCKTETRQRIQVKG